MVANEPRIRSKLGTNWADRRRTTPKDAARWPRVAYVPAFVAPAIKSVESLVHQRNEQTRYEYLKDIGQDHVCHSLTGQWGPDAAQVGVDGGHTGPK